MSLINLYTQTATPAAPDNPWWVIVVLTLLPILGGLYLLFKRWADGRLTRQEMELSNLKAVRNETLRLESVAAPVIPDPLKVMYIGTDDKDKVAMTTIWQASGLGNRLVTLDSPLAGYSYILEHPGVILFVIIYVEIIEKGYTFLNMVKEDDLTRNIPVLFMDGLGEGGKLKTFEMGGQGFLEKPLDMQALLKILGRLGYSTTFTKDA